MNRVAGSASARVVNAAPKLLGAETAVHQPFLVPGRLQRCLRDAGDEVENVRSPKGDKAPLSWGMGIGVAGIERVIAKAQQQQAGV